MSGLIPERCVFCSEDAIEIDEQATTRDVCGNCGAQVIDVAVDFSCKNCGAYGAAGGRFHGPNQQDESPLDAMRRNAHLN